MINELDDVIRHLVGDMVESAPTPPDFPAGFPARPARRPAAWPRVALGLAAAGLVVAGTIAVAQWRRGVTAVGEAEWGMEFIVLSPRDPEGLRAAVLAVPGVASAEYTITVPEPLGPGVTLEPGVVAPEARPMLTMQILLDPNADAVVVAEGLMEAAGLTSLRLSESAAGAFAQEYFDFAFEAAPLLGGDPPVYQGRLGPDPQFDTSGFGVEVPLELAAALEGVEPPSMPLCAWPESLAPTRVLHIGLLRTLGVRLFLLEGDPPCLQTVEAGGSSGGGFDFSRLPIYDVEGASTSSGGPGTVTARVPPETAIAVAFIDGVSPGWQRPVSGLVMFPTPVGEFGRVVVESYDVSGTLIDRIERWYPASPAPSGIALGEAPFLWNGEAEDHEALALEFVREVIGWTRPVAVVIPGDTPDAATVQVTDGATGPTLELLIDRWGGPDRAVLQVRTVGGPDGVAVGQGGTSLEAPPVGWDAGDGAEIQIQPLAGAVSALVVYTTRDGTQRVVYVPGIDLIDGLRTGVWVSIGPTEVADYQDLVHVLVLYQDRQGRVIAAASSTMAP